MTTATLPDVVTPPPAARRLTADVMAAAIQQLPADGRAYFDPVEWDEYVRLTDLLFASGRRIRVLYDRGRLEAMTVGYPHEVWKGIVTQLFVTIGLAAKMSIRSAGGMTVRRQDLDRGFEPDVCYYIHNRHRVQAIRPLDFRTDPVPDLAVEVEMSQTVLARLPLYAAMRVPEVWRFDGDRLTVLTLDANGVYQESQTSRGLPTIPLDWVRSYLTRAATEDETELSLELFERIRAAQQKEGAG